MALKCGIVGLPNVGKSTLFNALTKGKALAANYPFATKDPNVGVITVPDPRLDQLAQLVNPEKVLATTIEILDIAGLIKGASQGEGLGNQFLANIREVDAIIHVIRCFDDDNVIHVDGSIDSVRDKEIIDTELLLKDLETLEKRLEKLKKNAKTGEKSALRLVAIAQQVITEMEKGTPVRAMHLEEDAQAFIASLMLLTAKPVLYVCNVDENSLNGNTYTQKLTQFVKKEEAQLIILSAGLEAELNDLDDDEERQMFLDAYAIREAGLYKLIRSSYALLDLITYFTAGVKEVRAWTIKRNTKAPQAAGVIHTDFEKGFIRAEVIAYTDFIQYGSEAKVKESGKMSVEGKDYVVKDGDIMHFRFNV